MLKLPDMAYYDIYPPLVQLDKKVTLAEMRTTTLEAVKPLGPEYGRASPRRRRRSGWIPAAPGQEIGRLYEPRRGL
jgi:oligoendopeptidase F